MTLNITQLRNQLLSVYDNICENPYYYFPQWFQEMEPDALVKQPVALLGQDHAYWQCVNNLDKSSGIYPLVTVDNNRFGTEAHGQKVIGSDAFVEFTQKLPGDKKNLWAINFHMSFLDYLYFKRLCNEHNIRMLDWAEAFRLPQFKHVQAGQVNDLWDGLIQNFEAFLQLESLFDDEFSKLTLYSILLYRLTLNREYLWPITKAPHSEYFYSGMFSVQQDDTFVDIGAYTGDTLSLFNLATEGKFKHYYGFEPDPGTFQKLSAYPERHSKVAHKITLEQKAVAEQSKIIEFYSDWGAGSRIKQNDESGDLYGTLVQAEAVRLDDYFAEKPPVTMIKFDVEGAEMDGLRGGQTLFKTQKPKLAVCAYHLPTDILEITQFIHALDAGYQLAIRHHHESHWDTVIYASATH